MPATGEIVKLLMKHGPKALEWGNALAEFIRKNPNLPVWTRKQIDGMSKRLKELSLQRGDAAKVRGMLEIIRDGARKLEAHGGVRPETAAAPWLERADNINLRIDLAVAQPKAEQKRSLAGLKSEATTLLAELIEATERAGSTPGANSSHEARAD
jgi:hypothetical protein